MGDRDCVLGVDLGTTNVKAAAYDLRGQRRAEAGVEVALSEPEPGRAEQDPEAIVAAAAEAIGQTTTALRATGARVAGIGFSGAMHSLVGVDTDGRPLTPALVWADSRSTPQVEQIRRTTDTAALAERTGTPLHPMTPLAKLRWFAQEEPATFARVARWLSVKEYALLRLTGDAVADHGIASASGLLDVQRKDWDDEALALAGVDRDRLSELVPTSHRLAPLHGDWPRRLGLPPDVPLIAGSSDGALANLGVGAVEPGVAALTIGTSGAVRLVTDQPRGDRGGRVFCYVATDDRWIVGGASSNGGVVLRWARDRLLPELTATATAAGEDPYDLFDRLAAAVPVGAEGLLFLPHLLGERAPRWDASLRGALIGLTAHHRREHVLRALLEGVVLHLATVVEAMAALDLRPRAMRASGGFTGSDLWLGIAADVLDVDLTVPTRAEGSPFGAALLAMDALGRADAVDLALQATGAARTIAPDPGRAAVYRRLLAVYQRLEDRLQPEFAALAAAVR